MNEEGVVEEFVQLVGEADHAALNDAIELAGRAGEDVVEHLADGSRVVVWEMGGEEMTPRMSLGRARIVSPTVTPSRVPVLAPTRITGVSMPGTNANFITFLVDFILKSVTL